MAVILPNPRTWVANEIPPYSQLNTEIFADLTFLMQRPMIKLRQTLTQSAATGVWVGINFNAEDIDPFNWHNPSVNPTRIIPTFPGWYRGWFGTGTSNIVGGTSRSGYCNKNGSTLGGRAYSFHKPPVVATNVAFRSTFFLPMNGTTDYFEAMFFQDSGSAMNIPITAPLSAEFFCRYWGPL
jgi:hypothetical protein